MSSKFSAPMWAQLQRNSLMSAATKTYRDDVDAAYSADYVRTHEPIQARKRFPEYRRSGGAPTCVSGMHARRNKRWTWGSGRGAKLQNLRAFAGALAFLVASASSISSAITLDLVGIGQAGNTGFFSNGLGGVSYLYALNRTEMTNGQYVDFLNAVGASNPNGIYNASMGSDANGGITQSGSSGSFTYAVKAGTNSQGVAFANVPVNFVDWFDAARFSNWLSNGESTNPALLETGSYTLANATSGPLVSRNPGAGYFLPTIDEWVKAGFNNGGLTNISYTTYATNSNTKPVSNVVTPTTANTASYGGGALGSNGPLSVGSYTNSASFWGLYEMMGNIAEITETQNAGNSSQWVAMSGSFSTSNVGLDQFNLASLPSVYSATTGAAQIGFRIAAVPEPSTIAMAGAGLAGLAGLEWKRRRKSKLETVLV